MHKNSDDIKKLYVVVPCYNESEVIDSTASALLAKYKGLTDKGLIDSDSRILFVDDGSKDDTWDKIAKLHDENDSICGIKLSKNRGHQNALYAGLVFIKDKCDIAISMDADLQDDIDVMEQFIEKSYAGCDIVYGVRSTRDSDTAFKRCSAELFYKLMNLFGGELIYNHADYRLMSKRALDELSKYQEVNLFLRGIVPMIGYKTDTVEYKRGVRTAGKSKYPLRKMLEFAIDGITSFSISPIKFIMWLGFSLFLVSIVLMAYYIIGYYQGNTIEGWATIIVSLWGIGGLQLLSIGIIGEYIGKIYMETKKRPRYVIEKELI